jgi:hypothetical protein
VVESNQPTFPFHDLLREEVKAWEAAGRDKTDLIRGAKTDTGRAYDLSNFNKVLDPQKNVAIKYDQILVVAGAINVAFGMTRAERLVEAWRRFFLPPKVLDEIAELRREVEMYARMYRERERDPAFSVEPLSIELAALRESLEEIPGAYEQAVAFLNALRDVGWADAYPQLLRAIKAARQSRAAFEAAPLPTHPPLHGPGHPPHENERGRP